MKRFFLALCCFILCGNMFASIKIKEGSNSFMKSNGVAKIIFDWSEAQWDNWETLPEHWGNEYETYVRNGEKSFIHGFNEAGRKVLIKKDAADSNYEITVKWENFDVFWLPRAKHKVWATITVKSMVTGDVICVYKVKEFVGHGDFIKRESFTDMMEDLGEAIAKR